jgi:membrane fusion protein, multidrug efflux system
MRYNALSIVFLLLLLSACRNNEVAPVAATTGVVRVRQSAIEIRELSIPVHTSGVVAASEELKLSFKTGGLVKMIMVDEGAKVRKGDLLASLDLSEIEENVKKAETGYEKALRDFTRAENLYRDSVITLETKQNASSALSLAKSTLEIARFNLAHSRIIAPDDGVVLKKLVNASELVSPGYPVFLFGSSGKHWKVKAGVSDKDIIKINIGDSASVSFDAYPDTDLPAVVTQVGEISDPYTGTYSVELMLKETETRLASGFVAAVNLFPSAGESYNLIPVGALVEADGRKGYIYISDDAKIVRKVGIEIITLIDTLAAVRGIPDSIKEVITEGAAYVRGGDKVVVVR